MVLYIPQYVSSSMTLDNRSQDAGKEPMLSACPLQVFLKSPHTPHHLEGTINRSTRQYV